MISSSSSRFLSLVSQILFISRTHYYADSLSNNLQHNLKVLFKLSSPQPHHYLTTISSQQQTMAPQYPRMRSASTKPKTAADYRCYLSPSAAIKMKATAPGYKSPLPPQDNPQPNPSKMAEHSKWARFGAMAPGWKAAMATPASSSTTPSSGSNTKETILKSASPYLSSHQTARNQH